MDIYLKVTTGILITAILSLVLSKHGADISLLLTICVCSMVILTASVYIRPILDFASRLAEVGQLNHEMLDVLGKVVGIGLVSQIAGFICADAGNQTLGKALQIITTAVILCVSVPLLEEILSLVEAVLGDYEITGNDTVCVVDSDCSSCCNGLCSTFSTGRGTEIPAGGDREFW